MEKNLISRLTNRLRGYTHTASLTIRFTKTWPAAFTAYLLRQPMLITFRNGVQGRYGWGDIKKILAILADKISLSGLPDGIFEANIDGIRIRAPLRNLDSLWYIFPRSFYHAGMDYRGKIILDIAAYIGDTALYFWQRGAVKVICYEPVAEFFYWLEQNIALNGINAAAYNFGISASGGDLDVTYSSFDCEVGFVAGDRCIRIRTLALREVLHKHQSVDVIKLACGNITEGVLMNLDDTQLATVPAWLIETGIVIEDENMVTRLNDKFSRAGFKLKRFPGLLVFEIGDRSLSP